TLALDAEWRELRDVHVAGPFVAVLDEQPRSALGAPGAPAAALRAHQHPRPLELVAVAGELQVALLQRGVHVLDLRRPVAATLASPEGSGDSLKLRFCLYFSRTIAALPWRSFEPGNRSCKQGQHHARANPERGDQAEERGKRHRLVERREPAADVVADRRR